MKVPYSLGTESIDGEILLKLILLDDHVLVWGPIAVLIEVTSQVLAKPALLLASISEGTTHAHNIVRSVTTAAQKSCHLSSIPNYYNINFFLSSYIS